MEHAVIDDDDDDAPTHRFSETKSTKNNTNVSAIFDPRLDNVFKSVMYVPPMLSSETLEKKDMTPTNCTVDNALETHIHAKTNPEKNTFEDAFS